MLVPDHLSRCLEPPEYPVSWEIIKMTFTWKRKMCNASSCKRKTGHCANLSEKESMRHRVLTCSLQCTTFHCLTKYLCETNFWQFEINITNTGIHGKKTEWPMEIYIVVLLESSPTHWPDRSAINKQEWYYLDSVSFSKVLSGGKPSRVAECTRLSPEGEWTRG